MNTLYLACHNLRLSLHASDRLKKYLSAALMLIIAIFICLLADNNFKLRYFEHFFEKFAGDLPHAVIAYEKGTESKKDEKNQKSERKREIEVKPVRSSKMPTSWQTVSAEVRTDEIGTIEHPTLDGGIINAADGLPVSHPIAPTINVKNVKLEKKIPETKAETPSRSFVESHSMPAFDDRWATSFEVRQILDSAVQSGKLGYLLNQSHSMQMPASVALLPLVESRYEDTAISTKGAQGAWQLMAGTAQEQGILPEQRKDFAFSTKAALAHLVKLHQSFGNWTLAYAAYNAGEGRVAKALKAHPYALTLEALHLPIETQTYIKRLKDTTALIGQIHASQSL